MSWGQEVIVDCSGCNDGIHDIDHIEGFVADLCDQIKMVRVGDPEFIHIGDLGDKSGYTCFQMIRTSSVICHFCANGDAFFNVFSCKDLDTMTTIGVIKKWFEPKAIDGKKVVRG